MKSAPVIKKPNHVMIRFVLMVISITMQGFLMPAFGQWNKHYIDHNLITSCFVHAADIDGDLDMDMAATGYTVDLVVWYENNGGNPINWSRHTIDETLDSPHGVYVVDMDNDLDMDVLSAGYEDNHVVWYENNGGIPVSWTKHTIDENLHEACSVSVVDIDGDTDLDVAASGYDHGNMAWYENMGGTPLAWTKHPISNEGGPLRFVDMDNDLDLDLVTTQSSKVVWFENEGGNPVSWTEHSIDNHPEGVRQIRVGDIDADSDLDVVITCNNANRVIWYENTGGIPPTWDKYIIDKDLARSAGLDLTDIDGDNDVDAIAAGYDADAVVWYENEGGTPVAWTRHTIDFNLDGAGNLKTADLNNNGSTDIYLSGQNENAVVWYEYLGANAAYGKTMEINRRYVSTQGDTVKVNAQLVNPENHPVSVYAHVQGSESTFQDSIELYDDGLHGDGNATDNMWSGNKWFSGLEEDLFIVELFTQDLTEGTTHYFFPASQFTTIGPVVFHSVSSRNADDVLEPGANIRLYVTLKNNGKTATATDIKAQLVCLEPSWVDFTSDTWSYVDIAPGQTVRNSSSYRINILDTYPGNTVIPMEIHISSNDQLLWIDTFSIPVYVGVETEKEMEPKQYALYANYPNPFNPSTTIRYAIPKSSEVTLTIYDLLGREITTLVNKTQTPGEYSVIWNGQGYTSGIYICHLQAGDFIKTRKLVLQK